MEKNYSRGKRVGRIFFFCFVAVFSSVLTFLFCRSYYGKVTEMTLAEVLDTESVSETETEAFFLPELPSYASHYPELYGAGVNEFYTEDHTAYLTFDDGPSAVTGRILDILKERNAKATFFVTGKTGEEEQALMKRMVEEGHAIGLHSMSHDYQKIYQSVDSFLMDYDSLFQLIYTATGVKPSIFRFPGGSVNSHNRGIYEELTAEMIRRGFVYYDWNVSSQDNKLYTTAEMITETVKKGVQGKNRVIVLCHNDGDNQKTAEALSGIIDFLEEDGYTLKGLTPEVTPIVFSYDMEEGEN